MARDPDTVHGGSQREFPTTLWDDLSSGGDAAWDRIVLGYWKPVYAYIRRFWRKGNEEAKDLCQAYFAWLVERGKITPGVTRFRAYLKRTLLHFLTDARRHEGRIKRGGGVRLVSLEQIDPARMGPEASQRTPEEEFDAQWVRELLDEGMRELERRLTTEDKHVYLEVFRAYALGPSEPSYREVAERLGRTESDVRNYLAHCRAELRAILRERVRPTVQSDSAVEDELTELVGP